ncbi:2-amino-4-hydroxy-6-hydroxymethyldihydropteridine diphosphokinase [Croceibacterium sp. LX-88]|uniref:2-amino-4-hydroxy-6-hydroxymethyldihydropteridine pyrophosphokinase n=1 Tax=Croceibacterium selenioxidans TaxID=2838833 RepID=A0ABS5W544_9SPHN|nr:2-amino-4-hydroxy-6-hydroxymethyldihydropteridine diphosphokinase [Croceibacterium selenioxidans]MBT2134873.1 2-amino-4-hydroxy-6-hydroxymethyldihydropteridine diphosphokinase [Croceibacterium selenioxidans]
MTYRYLIALGSNRRHQRFGRPRDVLKAALERLEEKGAAIEAAGPIMLTDPIGPSLRRYANSAAVIETVLEPGALLALLKGIEREFGRRTGGQRWTSRVLDLDIVLWSGGTFAAPGLTIPHILFRERPFVLAPAARIAGGWRDPITGLSIRQLHSRLTRPGTIRR